MLTTYLHLFSCIRTKSYDAAKNAGPIHFNEVCPFGLQLCVGAGARKKAVNQLNF